MARKSLTTGRPRTTPAPTPAHATQDSFQNFNAAMGLSTRNVSAGATAVTNYITLNRVYLDTLYRGSWLVAAAVDIPADDMTRAGIDIEGDLEGADKDAMQAALRDMAIWQRLNEAIRWGRLYGGSVAVMMFKGQNTTTPLKVERIRPGDFQGLMVMDRWTLNPVPGSIVTDFGPDFGQPEYYQTVTDTLNGYPRLKIHHSRVIRFGGYKLPYYQRTQNMGWDLSVVERIYDILTAHGSTTTGMAQLVYKSWLRIFSVDGFEELVASGNSVAMQGFAAMVETMRLFQSLEGITVIDSEYDLDAIGFANFAGLSDVLASMSQQLCGALRIPNTRLFGSSPQGMNATGNGELRDYYDGVLKDQENELRRPMTTILDVLHMSLFGEMPPPGFTSKFRPLWQVTDIERATIAGQDTTRVAAAVNGGIVQVSTALKELKASGKVTGAWQTIDDEEIADAEQLPPLSETAGLAHEGQALGVEGQRKALEEPQGQGDATKDERRRLRDDRWRRVWTGKGDEV